MSDVRNELANEIEGIGPRSADLLAAVGIATLVDLRVMDLSQVHRRTGIPITLLEEWKAMAELQRVSGLDKQIAEVLVKMAGIRDLKALSKADPESLVRVLEDARSPRGASNIIPDSYDRPLTVSRLSSFTSSAKTVQKTKLKTRFAPTADAIQYTGVFLINVYLQYYSTEGAEWRALPWRSVRLYVDGGCVQDFMGACEEFESGPTDGLVDSLVYFGEPGEHTYHAVFDGDDDFNRCESAKGTCRVFKKTLVEGHVSLKGSEDQSGAEITACGALPLGSQSKASSAEDGSFILWPLPSECAMTFTYTLAGYECHEVTHSLRAPRTTLPSVELRALSAQRRTLVRCDDPAVEFAGIPPELGATLQVESNAGWEGLPSKSIGFYAMYLCGITETDSSGVASCTLPDRFRDSRLYVADFPGDAEYSGSLSDYARIGSLRAVAVGGIVLLEGAGDHSGVEIEALGNLPTGSGVLTSSSDAGEYRLYPLPVGREVVFRYHKAGYRDHEHSHLIRRNPSFEDGGGPWLDQLPPVTLRKA